MLGVHLALRFVLELALFASFAIAGASLDAPVVVRVLAALTGAAVPVLVWGRWMAPRSHHRLPDPRRLYAEWVLFALGGAALWAVGTPFTGTILVVAGTTNAVLLRRLGAEKATTT